MFGVRFQAPKAEEMDVPKPPIPRVTGFGIAQIDGTQLVCVHVEADDLEVWVGQAASSRQTRVMDDPTSVRKVSVAEAREVFQSWPASVGDFGDAVQAAAWHGRQMLIGPQLRALLHD